MLLPMTAGRPLLLALLLGALSCDSGAGGAGDRMPAPATLLPDEIPLQVQRRCPGDPGCEAVADQTFYAGVARRDITPLVEPFTDLNKNGVWDPGEPFEDKNGNGRFDAFWIAGFGDGRLAYGVHDPVWARAVALRQGKTTVVLVAVDTLGLFREETGEVQKLLDPKLHVDLLLIHGTHVHETADLTGGWGQNVASWGINEDYQHMVRRAIAAVVAEALADLQPARATFGSIAVEDGPRHDMARYVSDTRHPVVIDNVLHTIQFSQAAAPNAPIGTIVNWAHHPESEGSENHLISSDFVHYLREKVEQGGGGMAAYVSGALGGQIGPGRVVPVDENGVEIKEGGFAKAEAIGKGVARFALTAMADPGARTLAGKDLRLAFRSTVLNVQVANRKYHLAAMLKIFRRSFCCYDTSSPIDDSNQPWVETAISYLRLGPAAILTNPGELFPELFLGGYDGRYAGTYEFLDRTQPSLPDLGKAPQPPYLVDLMDGERPHRQTWGLTMDFLGYIMPRYDFLVDEHSPYFKQPPGRHYEETNSIGPLAEPQIVGTMRQLVLDGDGRPGTMQ